MLAEDGDEPRAWYRVDHETGPIAVTGEEFGRLLAKRLRAKRNTLNRWPSMITGLRVEGLDTVAGLEGVGHSAGLGASGIWLRARVVGLGRVNWEKRELHVSATLDDQYEFRDLLLEKLREDLVGPTSDDEEITDPPVTRYALGVLFPRESGTIDAEQDVDVDEGDDEASFGDPPIALANTRYPSSMGLTVAVDLAVPDRSWCRSRPLVTSPTAMRRQRRAGVGCPLPSCSAHNPCRRACQQSVDLGDGLELFTRVRKPDADNAVSVTLALVNRRSGTWPRDPDCFFQPSIVVRAEDDVECFVERQPAGSGATTRSSSPIACSTDTHATSRSGMGVRPTGTTSPKRPTWREVRTALVPAYALRLADSNPAIDTEALSLRVLDRRRSIGDPRRPARALRWLRHLDRRAARQSSSTSPTSLQTIARKHLDDCAVALGRMRRRSRPPGPGRSCLAGISPRQPGDADAASRTVWHEHGNPAGGPDDTVDHRWRPFQLAFILLCLRGVVDDHDEDRETADLLWFPTGGGKTEAYLGLIAFTLFLRRLAGRTAATASAVLMRYTLRLLTIQQFERAALLICCCEDVRDTEPRPRATEPFLIGLWVGRGGTPEHPRRRRQGARQAPAGHDCRRRQPGPAPPLPVVRHAARSLRLRGRDAEHATARPVLARKSKRGLRVRRRASRSSSSTRTSTSDAHRWSSRRRTSSPRCRGAHDGTDLRPRHRQSPPGAHHPGRAPPDLRAARHARRPLRDRRRPPLQRPRTARPKVIASTATIRRADRQTEGAVRPRRCGSSRRRASTRATPTSRSRRRPATRRRGCTSA